MGTIKIELDLPEFEKELGINIVIQRDGKVICNTITSTPPSNNQQTNPDTSTPIQIKKTGRGGNMMGLDF